ncbi:sulfatase-like hydrolase/transferase [Shewanella corallii]|uniref:Sulfatase-like hydrolase/transferase n=1 Tax=Shewanella corallii TaxID=560080 RepID=A0ABT0N798_9GAMM|nr:sulfatase-like hydrolase/transferase [Shewanella corallii]MCL2913702.1 sulfatase-like hydrolase/transferase [Shewanella corallii]
MRITGTLHWIMFGLLVNTAAAAQPPKTDDNKPNVLVVMADDMGFGHVAMNLDLAREASYNPQNLKRDSARYAPEQARAFAQKATPTLTQLAAEGVRFTNAYVPSPLCGPSRAALMTGRYPARFGIYNNADVKAAGLPVSETVLAKEFRNAGYRTGAIGKWHLSKGEGKAKKQLAQHPLDRGFDYFFGFDRSGTPYYGSEILEQNRTPAKAQGYLTDQLTDKAISFINQSDDDPFFLYLAYNAVHGPLREPAPEQYQKQFQSGDKHLDIFYAYLYALDQGVARVMQTLEDKGQLDNTIIMFLSDNGAPGGKPFPLPANAPFTGYKGQVWQGGTRVPVVIWGPDSLIKGGRVEEAVISSMDLLPTGLAATGSQLPDNLDGQNLLPGLQAGNLEGRNLYWASQVSHHWGFIRGKKGKKIDDKATAEPAWAVRSDNWMLRYWADSDKLELFDMSTDHAERKDLAAKHPRVVKSLSRDYAAWFNTLAKPAGWDQQYWRKLAVEE